MTPKDKAKELVESFSPYSDYNECDVLTQRENQLKNAKQCALICVDEILQIIPEEVMSYKPFMMNTDYWTEVKQEINKL